MIDALEVREEIRSRYPVYPIYLADIGSQAWGLESPWSDVDVVCLYLRDPWIGESLEGEWEHFEESNISEEWELDAECEVDVKGYCINKFFQGLLDNNCTMFEVALSPVVYWKHKAFPHEDIQAYIRESFSPLRLFHSYRSKAAGTYDSYYDAEGMEPKRILYSVLPLVRAEYILSKKSIPEFDYNEFIEQIEDEKYDIDFDHLREIAVQKQQGITGLRPFEFEEYYESVNEMRPSGNHHTGSLNSEMFDRFVKDIYRGIHSDGDWWREPQ